METARPKTSAEPRRWAELAGNDMPPVDVLYIADVALRFDVIDIPNLFADIRMDAAIVPGERTIYVDRDAIEGWDRRDRWSKSASASRWPMSWVTRFIMPSAAILVRATVAV